MPQRRVTLRDIAKDTGFHFTTVGLAMRGNSNLAEETVTRIRAAAQRLGYRPSPLLSALSAFRTRPHESLTSIIGYLVTYDYRAAMNTDSRDRRTIRAAEAHADAHGFKLEPIRVDLRGYTPARITSMLQARGIHAIILAPLMPRPGPFMELPWADFSVVGVGYSITNLRPHRVCFSHFQSMLLNLRELRARGYTRIGLTMTQEVNIRTSGNFLGAVLAEQHAYSSQSRVEPYIAPGVTTPRREFIRWLRRERPDCIIINEPNLLDWVKEEGLRVPDDIGVAQLSREDESSPIAGIDEQCEMLGEASVDFAISLLRLDERGLPRYPRYAMVEARWVYKPTVRAIAGDEDGGTRSATLR